MRFRFRLALAVLSFSLLGGRATADMLSGLLPAGVPGYGTAPGVTVATRLRPRTQPVGLRAGRFVLHPVLEEAVGYDTAPFGATGNGSWMLDTQPSLGIASDWSRDALGAYLGDEQPPLPVGAHAGAAQISPCRSAARWISAATG